MATGATQDYRPLAIETPLGKDTLLLTAVQGDEELSAPFRYEVEMKSSQDDLAAEDIVGLPASIRLESGPDVVRYLNGYVSEFSHVGKADLYSNYRAVLVPWFWFLDQTTDCRIFQDKSVKQIIDKIFPTRGFTDYRWQLNSDPPAREYCVQYRETDFNFVSRLLEEEGIFYFFEQENGKHTMVLADSSAALLQLDDSEVEYPDPSGRDVGANQVFAWQRTFSFRSGKYAHTDYNFKTPSTSLVRDQQTQRIKFQNAKNLEVFDFHGRHEDPSRGKALAKIRLEEIEARHNVARGESTCGSFAAGGKFTFAKHRSDSEVGKSYALTRVFLSARLDDYVGGVPFDYVNSFECMPLEIPFRPQRRARKPVVEGPQTAIVVGPEGETRPKGKGKEKELYVDEHARVKVRFHWIRDGDDRENSSCWMRVAQPWAGGDYGAMNIPRIGHEVIVDFLEGDPDCPIVNGRVYNAESMPNASNAGRKGNTPPADIPAAAMMTSFKSSSVGGSGSNEITMNDEGGKEGLFFKAQKDEIHDVGNDRTDTVGNDETRSVANNRSRKVGVDETVEVGNNQTITVGVNRTATIGTNDTTTVGTNQSLSVGASQSVNVGSSQSNSVGTMKNETVGIMSNEMVGVAKTLNAGAAYSINVGGIMNTLVAVQQTEQVGSTKKVTVGSKLEITCGASKLTMEAGGKVTIEGTEFLFKASGPVKINGAIIDLN